jgi:hypothetical protein
MQGHLNLPKRIHSEPLIVHWGVWGVEPIEPKRPRIEYSVNGHLFSYDEKCIFDPFKLEVGESMLFYGNSTEIKKF